MNLQIVYKGAKPVSAQRCHKHGEWTELFSCTTDKGEAWQHICAGCHQHYSGKPWQSNNWSVIYTNCLLHDEDICRTRGRTQSTATKTQETSDDQCLSTQKAVAATQRQGWVWFLAILLREAENSTPRRYSHPWHVSTQST